MTPACGLIPLIDTAYTFAGADGLVAVALALVGLVALPFVVPAWRRTWGAGEGT